MKHISLNFNIFKQGFKAATSYLFGLLSSILLFVTKEEIGIDTNCKSLLVVIFIISLSFVYAVIKTFFYKKKEIFSTSQGKLTIKYDDLWRIAFTKCPLKSKKKKIVVVGVNTAFDTIVDEDLSKIDKPLVSTNTLHGQWIKKMGEQNISSEDINDAIQNNLKQQQIKPTISLKKDRGNVDVYSKGTVAVYEYKNTIFYLLALSEFDENNNAQNTRTELTATVEKLINYYDKKGQGYDIYIPLLGTGRSRTNISAEESLETIASEIKINKSKIHGNINIIVYEKDRDKISIDI